MEFSFRDVNDEPSSSEDPLSGYSRPNCLSPGYIQNPDNVREVILRDLEEERKRIKEQLLVASNAHKLVMEAGWRIGLSLERQMAIVRSDNFPSISGSNMTRYDAGLSTMVPCEVRSVKDRLGPAIHEMNPTPVFSNEKFEITFPTQEVFCGAKRKAETPPPEVSGVPDIPSAGAKKIRKREWSCALCKLSFPNVQMLNDHGQGSEHGAAFRRFRLVSEEYNHTAKIVKSNGDHELEQNADESKKKIEKESTSQAILNIDDSRKENGNSTLQMLKLTNNSKKFITLSGGVDHENVMNDNKSREKISGESVEVAQTGGVYAEKACTHEKETNNTSSEIADICNLEQAKAQKNNSGSKRKAERQPLEAVGASMIPSADAKKNPKQEFRCRPCGLFQVFFSNEQINEHMEGRRHKAAERREKFATGLVPKDNNNCVKTVKVSCNRNLDQVIQNSEELKLNGEKSESAEAATQMIDDSKKINGNSVVQLLKIANNSEKFMAPSTSQNDGFQVGKTSSVDQETTMISPTKDKDMHKLEQAKAQGFLFGAKRKAEIPPEVSGGFEIPSASANKNRKTKWSCALCKLFNFPNMQMLNYHVHGREHIETFRRLRLVSEEDNHPVKTVKAFHELKQNADRSYEGNEKEVTSQATLNIDDSNKENGNSAVQMLKLTNSNKKFKTLSGEHDHENAMNDNRNRELISREFVEVAQNGGVYVEKASTNKKQTNNISSETALTNNAIYNLEQKHVSGAKRKAEMQPPEVVGASKLPSAGAKKNPKQEFSCRPCGLFQVVLSNDQINEHMQGMEHKAAEKRERFGTGLVPKDNNNHVETSKFSCNRNLDQVSEELKKVTEEKNESAEAATEIIDDSRKGNGNSAVQQPVNSNENFMAPSTSQNGGSQVGKTFTVQQETTKISTTKDKDIQKLKQAKPQGNVSGFKHKAETQPLEIVGASKIPSASAKKKLKQEFRCALCQVVVPTEIMFIQHIQGRRHKAAESCTMLVNGSVPKGNNSFANIAEKGNNCKFVWVNKNEKEIKEKNESANIAEKKNNCKFVWVNKDEKEIKEKNDSAEGGTQNIDYSKKEIGTSAVQILKLATNNEKFMASSTVLEVESENEKTVDNHKKRQNQSVELHEVAHNGGSQVEKAFSEEQETTKISSEIVGTEDKDSHKLVQAISQGNASGVKRKAEISPPEVGGASKIPSFGAKKKLKQVFTCGLCRVVVSDEKIFNQHIQGMRHKANIEAQSREWFTIKIAEAIIGHYSELMNQIRNADNSRKEVGEKNELAFQATANIEPLYTFEGNIHLSGKLLEVAHNGGSHAEQEENKVSTNIGGTKDGPSLEQGKGELYSREFLLVGSNFGSQGKKATSMERETNSGTNNRGNSVQNADESAQEVLGAQLFQNIFKSEKEKNNLTEKALKIRDRKGRFKFMCKICKVGSNTERVMIAHNSKQRHLEKLRELAENGVSVCVEKAADGVPEHEKEKNI